MRNTAHSVILLLVLAVLLCCDYRHDKATPSRAEQGVIDLRQWNFEEQGPIRLDGTWQIHWAQLLAPQDFTASRAQEQPDFIKVPGAWNGSTAGGKRLPGEGYATFRLKLLLQNTDQMLGLKINYPLHACKLWINDRLLCESGKVGASRKEMSPARLNRVVYFHPQGAEQTVTVQVSNFHHRAGGFHDSFELGTAEQIQAIRDRKLALDLFLFGSIFIMTVYHAGLFISRRKDVSLLYFALLCLLISVRTVLTSEIFLTAVFSRINWEIQLKLEYLTYYMSVPLLMMFYRSLYPAEMPSRVLRAFQVVGLAFILTVILTPVRMFSYTLIPYSIYTASAFVCIALAIVSALKRSRDGAILFMAGFVIILLTAANDVLFSLDAIRSVYLSQFGFFLFLLPQTVMVSRRFAQACTESEERERDLLKANAAYIKEINERRRAEEDIRDLQRQIEFILGATKTGLAIIDTDHRIRYIDPEWRKRYGEIGGMKCHEYFACSQSPCPDCGMEKSRKLRGTVVTEGVMVKENDRPVQIIYIPYQDQSGEWLVAEVNIDITERKKVEHELSIYHHHLEEIIRWRTSELTITNEKLQMEIRERKRAEEQLLLDESRLEALLELNQMAECSIKEITDFALEEAVRLTNSKIGYLALLNQDETLAALHSLSKNVIGKCEVHNNANEFPIERYGLLNEAVRERQPVITNDCRTLGSERTGLPESHLTLVRHMNLPVFDGKRIVAVAGVANKEWDYDDSDVRQLTLLMQGMWRLIQRKNQEDELLKAKKIESLGILAGGIAHDFNNLLTIIYGNISLAKLSEERQGQSYSLLNEAEKAATKAKNLTQQLLTFSRGGAPIKTTASIENLLKDTVNFVLSGSNVRCLFVIPENLWSAEIDEGQISQVIHNIVINSRQAMPSGGTITITAENVTLGDNDVPRLRAGDYLKIVIADQGKGIPKEHLNKIFDPYFTTRENGSGLGLAVTYSIIKNHGGFITAASDVNGGAVFNVFLPASKEKPVEKQNNGHDSAIMNGKILIMDDDSQVLKITRLMLENMGFSVECSRHGEEMIELYRKARENGRPFDAVIMDLTVPGRMGGAQTIARLREYDPSIRAIVSSGYSNDPIMGRYRDYGFSAVLAKPYRREELGEVLANVLK